jgi:DNA-directed RNA polymerase
MGDLEFMVKKEFILLYSNDNFLQTFHNRIIQSIKDNQLTILDNSYSNNKFVLLDDSLIKIPNTPKLGKLDLIKIIESKYMIT